jgi:hypothetical protein
MIQAFSRAFSLALALLLITTGCASQQERKPAIILEQEQATKNSRFVATVPAGWTVSQATELKSGVVQMFVPPGQRSDGTSTTVLVLYGLDGAKALPEARQMLEKFGRAQMQGQPVSSVKEVKVGERKAMLGAGHTETGDKGPSDYVFLAMPDGDHLLLAVYMGDEDAVSVGLEEAMSVIVSVQFKTPHPEGDTRSSSSADPIEANSQLASRLNALLDDLMLLSLQPGNDEDENKAVSDQIDAVHNDAIRLYDDLNQSEYSLEALAPLEPRYWALRQRADKLITDYGPLRKNLPAPFAALSQELVRLIGLCRQEIHADDADKSRLKAVEELHSAAAELNDDVIWSGLRNRRDELTDLQARFAVVRQKGQAFYP